MDIDERSPKRRRTSSSASSRTSDRPPRHALPLRRQDSDRLTGGRYAPSSQDDSRDNSRMREARRSSISDLRTPSTHGTRSPSPIARSKTKRLAFSALHTIPKAHARGITCLKFSPDGSLLATSSADATIHIYSVSRSIFSSAEHNSTPPSLKHLKTLHGHAAGINAIAWSPRGPPYTLASASDDKSIMLWQPLNSDTPIPPSPLFGHSNYVYSLAFSPKGNMLVSGSYDEAVFLWDVRAGRVMRNLPAHSDPVGGVDFLPVDGTMVVSCGEDGLIRIWDAGTGQCLRTLVDEDRKPVTSVRFSPNGRFVLAWTLDGCIRLWRYIEGKGDCVKTYQGHVNREYSLTGTMGSYGPRRDEAFVVSGSENGDLVVWDVSTKEVLWRGTGHKAPVLGVDFVRPPGAAGTVGKARGLLASGGLDRDVRIWIEDVGPEDEEDEDEGEDDDHVRTRPGGNRRKRREPDEEGVDGGFKREDTEDEMMNEQLMDGLQRAADAADAEEAGQATDDEEQEEGEA